MIVYQWFANLLSLWRARKVTKRSLCRLLIRQERMMKKQIITRVSAMDVLVYTIIYDEHDVALLTNIPVLCRRFQAVSHI